MKFSIVVYAAPYSSEAAISAYKFCQGVLSQGHDIYRLFFFGDGVHNASSLAVAPQDENNLQALWDALIKKHQIDSVICVSSALKRGIVDQKEALRHELTGVNAHESSQISGLGQLVDAAANSDRLVNFG